MWTFLLLALALFAIDAAVKYWAQAHLVNMRIASPFYPYGGIGVFRDVMGVDFSLSLAKNKGAAWSIFSEYPQALLFVRIGIILAIAIYTLFVNKVKKRTFPFVLVLVGASANIADHFIYGAVIDMFYFVLWGYSYPVFNVADTLIFLGVATLALQTLREKFKRKVRHAAQPSKS